jgi:hypothetical protein
MRVEEGCQKCSSKYMYIMDEIDGLLFLSCVKCFTSYTKYKDKIMRIL